MRKILRRTFKTIFLTLIVLFILLLSLPRLFKEDIRQWTLREIDHKLNAKVMFKDIHISFFHHFPKFTILLDDICVTGLYPFVNDTLVSASQLSVSINILTFLKGNEIDIGRVNLLNPILSIRILPTGETNYNILKPESLQTSSTAKSKFNLNINEWSIENGRVIYDDQLQRTYINLGGLFHEGSGDFQQVVSDLNLTTKIADLTLMYNGLWYFKKKLFAADLNMEMNLKEKKFTFKDHSFQLGAFKFGFDGYIQLLEEGYKTNLTFNIKETAFKNLLSLLPGIYQEDLEAMESKGNFACSGFLKGVYDATKNLLPAFHLDLEVQNAYFKYNHLPKAIENIRFHLVADNPDGIPEHAVYDLKTFHLDMDKNPVHGNILIKGRDKMLITADIKVKADLADIEKMFPIDSLVIRGLLDADIKIKGTYDEEKKTMPFVDANITLNSGYLKYKNSPLEMDSIHFDAEMNDTTGHWQDARIDLHDLSFLLDGEPFTAQGNVTDLQNYDYALKIDGLVDLGKLTKLYPVASTTLNGTADFDLNTSGNLAELEAKKFQQLKTTGTLEIKNFACKNPALTQSFHLDDALFTFNPDNIVLERFQAEYGKSNLSLSGHLYNYIPFLLRNSAPIKGDLTLHCDTIDMNQWFPSSAPTTTATSSHSLPTPQPFIIPKNIGFIIDSDIKMFKFGAIDFANVDGEIRIKNGTLTMNETGFSTMDSQFKITGDYNSMDSTQPFFDMVVKINKLDFDKAYKTIIDPKGTAPAMGNFSTLYTLSGLVAPGFSPIYESLKGKGKILIDSVTLKGMKLFNHITSTAHKNEFQDPNLRDISLDTEIKNGKFIVYPFTIKVGKFLTEIEGEQSIIDESINYLIKLSVPPFNRIKIPMLIKGNPDKPIISIGKGFNNSDFDKL